MFGGVQIGPRRAGSRFSWSPSNLANCSCMVPGPLPRWSNSDSKAFQHELLGPSSSKKAHVDLPSLMLLVMVLLMHGVLVSTCSKP